MKGRSTMMARFNIAALVSAFLALTGIPSDSAANLTPVDLAAMKRALTRGPGAGRLTGAPRMRSAAKAFDWDVSFASPAPEHEDDTTQSGPSARAPSTANLECQFGLWDDDGYYWTLAYVARLKNPNGQILATQQNSLYKPSISGWIVNNAPLIAGQYRCEIDWYVNGSYIGTGLATYQSPGQVPTSLNMYYTNTSYPAGYRYFTVRDYQVRDQNTQAIQRVMFADESFTTGQNTCGLGFVQGDGNTQANGTFRDNLYMAGNPAVCQNNGTCTTVKNQTWKIDGQSVAPGYTLTYTCSGVTVQ